MMERVLFTKARIIVLVGGRSSGKSEGVGRILLCWAQTQAADVLCGREYQNSIDDSVHKLLKGLIEKLGVNGVNVTDKKIDFVTGGGFRYKGFARNSAAVRSSQGFKYSWIEEGQDLSEQSIEDLLPTIRAEDSKLLFTANVMASNDPFSKRFVVPFKKELDEHGFFEDDMHLIIKMNWRDNPWHGELENQRLWDYKNLPRAKYDHIWEGAFNDSVDDSIIQAEWFDAAIDAHIELGFKPQGIKIVSHDPSDLGADPKGLVFRHGSVILNVMERKEGDVNEGCDWATSFAIQNNADWFVWDCDGMGVSLKRQVTDALDGTKTGLIMFKGSESPVDPKKIYQPDERLDRYQARTNEETFRNKRAQYYMRLRDRFYKTYRAVVKGEYHDPDEMISISSNIEYMDQFRSECCRIPRKYNPNGYFQIMTKKEMKLLHKIESPNLADPAMMSMEIPRIFKQPEYESFEIPNQKRL
jgi:phage terminase large subunit